MYVSVSFIEVFDSDSNIHFSLLIADVMYYDVKCL